MNKDIFLERKESLYKLIIKELIENKLTTEELASFSEIVKILNQYTYNSRLQKKGILARTIVDSSTLDYAIGEKFIEFDNSIT